MIVTTATKIPTLIVDDEPLAREGVRLLLQKDADIDIIGECDNGRRAVKVLQTGAVSLLFLDVHMGDINGFEVLRHIHTDHLPVVVFITAFDQYALEAFRVHAVDYLLKPFSDEEFYESLKHVKQLVRQKKSIRLSDQLLALMQNYGGSHAIAGQAQALPSPDLPANSPYVSRIPIYSASRIYFLKADHIDWIEAADYYLELHANNKVHVLRETMQNMEANLDPSKFVRIHRSTIVNIDLIQGLEPYFNGEYILVLKNGKKFKVSRGRREKLKALFHLSF